ncbi:DUF6377 domain-containing protein [Rhodocytophaga aerolata]|uniref:histidine kinase n=1 Tax=Rhodocytophaga aerolata TaxID=455078 RepID=A0ABT8RDA1_9BACT|nr:DUF6377 domain-containing protein [Rhodocytophaga aerolata]MDO1449696.1 DUF6377 domain-containing protein [Rhodocytophaga aerolata]
MKLLQKATFIIYIQYSLYGLLWIACCTKGYSQAGNDQWIETLNQTIEQSQKYDEEKLIKIEGLYQSFPQNQQANLFENYLQLYNEYVFFNCDSAYAYAKKLQETAVAANDSSQMAYAGMKLGFVLLSSGMFKEAFDWLSNISTHHLAHDQKAEYYTLLARCYYDLADYNQDKFYSPHYTTQANGYIDSALVLFPEHSFNHRYYRGLQYIRNFEFDTASHYLAQLLDQTDLSLHQLAMTAATLSDVYSRKGANDTAIYLLSRAAIADIQSSTKENQAIFHLATLLYKEGDFKNASRFIQKAADDAHFYGSRQRKLQLSEILPLIEAKKLTQLEGEKRSIITYAIVITLSFVLLTGLTVIIVKQVKKLKSQQKVIRKKNRTLQQILTEKEDLLAEKEWLLKEIHHRVKNNLHMVTSLLESQSAYLEDNALSAIRDSQHRVFAMSLIHQKLYQSEKVASIDMSVYLHELVQYLQDSFDTNQHIRFQFHLEPIELNVSQAVPIGLILNEAITNAVKHAFPPATDGIITVEMTETEEHEFLLSVADNGIGYPADFHLQKANSLGIKLMKGLSEDIGAQFKIKSHPDDGTRVSIVFTIEKASQQIHPSSLAHKLD